jgi:hypothetical protein
LQKLEATQSQQVELRLVLSHLEAFRDRLAEGLADADWTTRRNIVCAQIRASSAESVGEFGLGKVPELMI